MVTEDRLSHWRRLASGEDGWVGQAFTEACGEIERLQRELDLLKKAAKTVTENDWYGRLARAEAAVAAVEADALEQQRATDGVTLDPWKLGVYAQASRTRRLLRDLTQEAGDATRRSEDVREEADG